MRSLLPVGQVNCNVDASTDCYDVVSYSRCTLEETTMICACKTAKVLRPPAGSQDLVFKLTNFLLRIVVGSSN